MCINMTKWRNIRHKLGVVPVRLLKRLYDFSMEYDNYKISMISLFAEYYSDFKSVQNLFVSYLSKEKQIFNLSNVEHHLAIFSKTSVLKRQELPQFFIEWDEFGLKLARNVCSMHLWCFLINTWVLLCKFLNVALVWMHFQVYFPM